MPNLAVLPLLLTFLAPTATALEYKIQRIGPSNTGSRVSVENPPQARVVLPLTSKVTQSSYKQVLAKALRGRTKSSRGRVKQAELAGAAGDVSYLADIVVGGQSFKVVVDTGTSDLWLANKGYQCNSADCAFGPVYETKKSKTYKPIKDRNFNTVYGDGEYLKGTVASETVTIGGLTAKNQTMGVVNVAYWFGDGHSSGLLGLAYPSLGSVYSGNDTNQDSNSNLVEYDPFFYTAVKQGQSAPYFSLALNRGSFKNQANTTYDPHLGYLAFGGKAPVKVVEPCVTVPIQGYTVSAMGVPKYMFYSVNIDSYNFNSSTSSSPLSGSGKQAIIDSGTTINYLPTSIANAYNALFQPPATYSFVDGNYHVDCNAKVPSFAVTIGGKKFTIDKKDQILPNGIGSDGKLTCITGTSDGGDPADSYSIFVLGDTFLHNVVSTFNINTQRISLSQRSKY